jgi:hypothetical protein
MHTTGGPVYLVMRGNLCVNDGRSVQDELAS